jgi:hypothetical protein
VLNYAPRHENILGEWRHSSTHPLTSVLEGEWSALCPGRFTPRKRTPGTLWLGWVGPRAGLNTVSKRKIPSPRLESNPDHPIVQPVASCCTNWAIPALPSRLWVTIVFTDWKSVLADITYHGLSSLACSESEFMKLWFVFRYCGRTPWTEERPIESLVPTQDRIIQRNAGIHPFLAGFEPTIPVFERSKIMWGPTQPPIQWIPGALSLGVERPGCEADHSPPSSAEVQNSWRYTSTPLIHRHGVVVR